MGLDLPFLLPEWQSPPGVRALSTLRAGGVSRPPWDSLNLGAHVGDDPAAVDANRHRLREAADLPAEPQWLEQVHGIVVADLDLPDARRRADAAVSSRPGRVRSSPAAASATTPPPPSRAGPASTRTAPPAP